MSNKNLPNGFKPKGECIRSNKYTCAGTIYPGDLVKLDSSGNVTVASAGDAIVGAALSYATSTIGFCLVADDPAQLFTGQVAAAEVAAQTNLNLNYNHTASTASTLFKVSRQVIDGTSGATNSNLTLKLVALTDEIGEGFGSYAKCVLKINNHQLAGGTGTLGT